MYTHFVNRADGSVGAYLPAKERYVGCAGSKPVFRGFPCAKWQLWHFLVMQGYRSGDEGDVLDILKTMREYIRLFFTCSSCREHFLKATENFEEDIENNIGLLKQENKVRICFKTGSCTYASFTTRSTHE
jgi:hypothetical protein